MYIDLKKCNNVALKVNQTKPIAKIEKNSNSFTFRI